jgi:hypothetical protein
VDDRRRNRDLHSSRATHGDPMVAGRRRRLASRRIARGRRHHQLQRLPRLDRVHQWATGLCPIRRELGLAASARGRGSRPHPVRPAQPRWSTDRRGRRDRRHPDLVRRRALASPAPHASRPTGRPPSLRHCRPEARPHGERERTVRCVAVGSHRAARRGAPEDQEGRFEPGGRPGRRGNSTLPDGGSRPFTATVRLSGPWTRTLRA